LVSICIVGGDDHCFCPEDATEFPFVVAGVPAELLPACAGVAAARAADELVAAPVAADAVVLVAFPPHAAATTSRLSAAATVSGRSQRLSIRVTTVHLLARSRVYDAGALG
jgi:hypothetical protein